MCLQRYAVISNSKKFKFENFRIIFPILVVFSSLNYLPRIFFSEITTSNDGYVLVGTYLSKQLFGIILDFVMSAVRGPLLMILIIAINFLTAKQFFSLMNKKRKLNQTKKHKGNLDNKNIIEPFTRIPIN